jgi:hypothetical protein
MRRERDCQLAEVIPALCRPARLARRLHRRKEQGEENANYEYYDEDFNERKAYLTR